MYKVKFYDWILDSTIETLSSMNDGAARKEAWQKYMVDAGGGAIYSYKEDYSLGYDVINPDNKVIWRFQTGEKPE